MKFGSCVFDFIKQQVSEGIKEFIFFSDNRAGKNCIHFMYCMYMFCAANFSCKITHIFSEKGHTQNEVDSIHSVIERAAKKIPVYTPS